MARKQLPFLLSGGIVGFIVSVVISIFYSISNYCWKPLAGGLTGGSGGCSVLHSVIYGIGSELVLVVPCVLIGVGIGFIISKIVSR